MYSHNKFDLGVFLRVKDFSMRILPQRLQMIRSLSMDCCYDRNLYELRRPREIEKWFTDEDIIKSMYGLQNLYVRIHTPDSMSRRFSPRIKISERRVLQPLKELGPYKNYCVSVVWLESDRSLNLADMPFTLLRPATRRLP